MRFMRVYLTLKLKELSRSTLYRGFAAFLLALALCMTLLIPKIDANSPLTLAILNSGDTRLGRQVTDILRRDGGYLLRPCADRRELEALVLSGEALCGYAFEEDADSRVEKARYTQLITGFYREKSPAAALCDEAVCGAVFSVVAPDIAGRYLAQGGQEAAQVQEALKQKFANTMAYGHPMSIQLLGAQGQELPLGKSRTVTGFLYAMLYSLTAVFAIVTAFYTRSLDHLLGLAGQRPFMVRLCSFFAYAVSYLGLLGLAHLAVACLLPELLLDGEILLGMAVTALVGAALEQLSRRLLSPAILPLLPFVLVLAVAVQVL